MINPYENVDWENDVQIVSISHAHVKTQEQFNCLYAGGVRHIAISNYYRSEPFYPVVNGKISGIESAETVTIPNDCVPCPNAEHHNMNISGLHMCTIGSFFSSGTPEIIDSTDGSTDRSGRPKSMEGASWKDLIKLSVPMLQYADGGGLTINHPTWSNLSLKNIFSILDYTPYVLGIEAYNTNYESDLKYWDDVLITGRRAWGFFVPDHKHKTKPAGNWLGRNVLIVPNRTEYECLKAYREGRFYGRLRNTDLSFTDINLENNVINCSTNLATTITIIKDGQRYDYSGSSYEYEITDSPTYIRIEATDGNNVIFSQPFIFKQYIPKRKDIWQNENKNIFGINRLLWM